jgi:hypothetical protein
MGCDPMGGIALPFAHVDLTRCHGHDPHSVSSGFTMATTTSAAL